MAAPFDPAQIQQAVAPVAAQANQQAAAAPPQPPPGNMAGPYGAIIGGNLADYLTTVAALKRPGVHETNPMMQSPAALAAMKGGSTLAQLLIARTLNKGGHPTAAKWTGYGLGSGMGAIAAHNMTQGK